MIAIVMASVIHLAAMQASIAGPRAAFSACLKEADVKALAEKVGAEAYGAYVKAHCTVQAETFKKALVSFDVKNGISRKQAATDAELQIDDYVGSSTERYQLITASKGEHG